MDLFSGLSDDQTALVGCFVALVVCGGIMALSFYLKPRSAREALDEQPVSLAFTPRSKTAAPDEGAIERRKAA